MSKGIEKLRRAIGRHVSALSLDVLFYGGETKGDLICVLIDFTDGARFALICGGDGGIFVVRSPGKKGDAPGFVTHSRTLENFRGELRGVSVLPEALRLQIGDRELLLANEGDELSLTVDGKPPPQELLRR